MECGNQMGAESIAKVSVKYENYHSGHILNIIRHDGIRVDIQIM